MSWLSWLWSAPRREHAPAVSAQIGVDGVDGAPPGMAVCAPHFLPWLLDTAPLTALPLSPAEQAALAEIHRTLGLASIPDSMLPRASALVPQLIALLRETELPLAAIAGRVSKDAALTAEVMRLASSPYYRTQGEVSDMQQAIALIGSAGLQTVIARVVLRPIFQDRSGLRSAGAAQRLWEHAEALARHAAALAGHAGQPSFDAYLTGLLHNTGWKVALCTLERAGIALEPAPSDAFAVALTEQSHRLFGHVAQGWAITPGFTEFACDARANGLSSSNHPLAPVLRAAHQHCMQETAGGN